MKDIERIRNCRLLLRGLLYLIGPALGVFNFLVLCSDMQAGYFSGCVFGVSDGDTISVMHGGRSENIRLYGIDAPEKGKVFGNRAKQFVSTLAFGNDVKVEVRGQDRYGRRVADVIIRDGKITPVIRCHRSEFFVLG